MEGFARGAEEGGETGSADDGLLDGVKFGLSPPLAFLLHFFYSLACFSHLRKALVQPIDRLQRFRIREGQSVWAETDNVPMFSVERNVGEFGSPFVYIVEAPPVCERGKEGPGIFIETTIETVGEEVGDERDSDD